MTLKALDTPFPTDSGHYWPEYPYEIYKTVIQYHHGKIDIIKDVIFKQRSFTYPLFDISYKNTNKNIKMDCPSWTPNPKYPHDQPYSIQPDYSRGWYICDDDELYEIIPKFKELLISVFDYKINQLQSELNYMKELRVDLDNFIENVVLNT